ncbi:gliding motility-associated C-terminal domain-containing protein [Catalinimonas alkaloidigena]|uniref:Gliding motility-associated C-terminal domain-containing protein n=1 Tax=Catalinimonas alkaloidigena TaxID=1075417 RepID=A0A1G9NC23_9BACT|nr:gliding motility-associated C-terminal domain-containing protein [Catalinimonas alkaloidigena]SDL84020.1 gliding motility-associated C-terminal domain-containing protein [Catalinimonas alkaloidigena]
MTTCTPFRLTARLCWLGLFWIGSLLAAQAQGTPGFALEPDFGCVPLSVQVTDDASKAPPGGRTPAYDNGQDTDTSTFSAVDPVFYYDAPGVYLVKQLVDGTAPLAERIARRRLVVLDTVVPNAQVAFCEGNRVRLTVDDRDDARFLLPGRDYGTYAVGDTTLVYDQYRIRWGDGQEEVVQKRQFVLTHTYNDGKFDHTVQVQGLYSVSACGGTARLPVRSFQALAWPALNRAAVQADGSVLLQLQVGITGRYRLLRQTANGLTALDTLANEGPQDYASTAIDARNQSACFRFEAFDVCGNTLASPNLCTTRLTATPNAAQNSITLSWPRDQSGFAFRHYTIYRDNRPFATLPDRDQTSFVDTGPLQCGQRYQYHLVVTMTYPRQTAEIESHSLPVEVTAQSTVQPEPVQQVQATVNLENQVVLSWRAPSPTPSAYQIRQMNPAGKLLTLFTAGGPAFTDQQADLASQPYCYEVLFTDTCGNVSRTSTRVCPIRLTGDRNETSVRLTWTEYEGWPGGAQQYFVERIGADGTVLDSAPANGRSFQESLDDLLDAEEQVLRYRIRAAPNDNRYTDSYSNLVTFRLPYRIYFPTAFTPNGDGLNDTFHGFGRFVEQFTLRIFDRWGEVVFQTNDFTDAGWDGTFRGMPLPPGLYPYTVSGTDETGRPLTLSGKVQLIR